MDDVEAGEGALWRRGREGDAEAFGVIFDRHKDRVFRHAFALLRDRHDAEDATGAAFLELWRRRSAVRVVDGSVLPWLLVTVGHVSSNIRRSTARYRRLLDRVPRSEEVPAADEAALARLAPLDDELRRALQQLGSTDRGLLALVLVEGYPVAAAAEVLDLTPGAAKTRLSRLKARLRAALAPAYAAEGDLS